ncbi:MAG: hypothetical protein M1321_00930 [Candidatus Marsarchaeota archaeon]|nr:hypothetical protein [Candidatus Marsarchaeota archaeon]
MDRNRTARLKMLGNMLKIPVPVFIAYALFARSAYAATSYAALDIISTLNGIQGLLMHIGPVLSAVLFVVAGIFYAVGQLFPSQKRASLHSASIDIIIGAIIVAVLSIASTGLAVASTNLLSNVTANSI